MAISHSYVKLPEGNQQGKKFSTNEHAKRALAVPNTVFGIHGFLTPKSNFTGGFWNDSDAIGCFFNSWTFPSPSPRIHTKHPSSGLKFLCLSFLGFNFLLFLLFLKLLWLLWLFWLLAATRDLLDLSRCSNWKPLTETISLDKQTSIKWLPVSLAPLQKSV